MFLLFTFPNQRSKCVELNIRTTRISLQVVNCSSLMRLRILLMFSVRIVEGWPEQGRSSMTPFLNRENHSYTWVLPRARPLQAVYIATIVSTAFLPNKNETSQKRVVRENHPFFRVTSILKMQRERSAREIILAFFGQLADWLRRGSTTATYDSIWFYKYMIQVIFDPLLRNIVYISQSYWLFLWYCC